jgi:hypothetical protein
MSSRVGVLDILSDKERLHPGAATDNKTERRERKNESRKIEVQIWDADSFQTTKS